MSLRKLVEGDCGGMNPLMQFGNQFIRDVAHKDDGLRQIDLEHTIQQNGQEQMLNEFLGKISQPPQTFHMDDLMKEMQEIEQNSLSSTPIQAAPRVIDEVVGEWSKEFLNTKQAMPAPDTIAEDNIAIQHNSNISQVQQFFDEQPSLNANSYTPSIQTKQPYLAICPPYQNASQSNSSLTRFGAEKSLTHKFFDEAEVIEQTNDLLSTEVYEDWVNDFYTSLKNNEDNREDYNEKFWQHLQNEWAKLSADSDYPWLSELDANHDPYKQYTFTVENPLEHISDPLAKGKEYMAKGDIPSAVLCFEAAVQKDATNAEGWELLGMAQAENEMDPQAIAALKQCQSLQPENDRVLMALAICYTNESLQSMALKMLTNWLQIHPKYKHLLPLQNDNDDNKVTAGVSSLISGNKLKEMQQIFLAAVRSQPQQIDAEIQEALGVLYNLSSEFDKAVDCFRTALSVKPQSAKIWNRLGASLANGTRSVEAIEAYQRALELEPGFIRVRYNIGVCCLNLKAYKQAAEHFLTALTMQVNAIGKRDLLADGLPNGDQQMSETIWSSLKMTLALLGRNDLLELVQERNLTALNDAFKD